MMTNMRAAALIAVSLLLSTDNIVLTSAQGHKTTADNTTCWTQIIQHCKSSQPAAESDTEYQHLKKGIPSTLNNFPKDTCNPWMFKNETSGVCECSDIPYKAVRCDHTIPMTSILTYYCMTFKSDQNVTELGECLYRRAYKQATLYYKLPQNVLMLNEYMCRRANRDSTLCGACMPGLSPRVYSYNMSCMNCTGMTYNWIKYIAAAYVPLTFFFFLAVICRFKGTSPLVRGAITICQALMSPVNIRGFLHATTYITKWYANLLLKIFSVPYGIWNLDFFRLVLPPICLDITPLQALALDYAIAFYPLLLVLLTYSLVSLHSRGVRIVVLLWKPFHKVFVSIKRDWNLEGSVLQAFATFFLLFFLKILNVTTDFLVYVEKYVLPLGEQTYQIKYALYYDASVEYFKGDHLYYGTAAVFVGIFFVILPLVFLVIYPMGWFQKCLNRFKVQHQSVDMLVNCYQGYYKDGTNGTRDYRCFSISFFLMQIIYFVLFTVSKNIYSYSIIAFVLVLFLFITLAVQPYKDQFKAYSIIDAFMLLISSSAFIMITAGQEADLEAVSFGPASYVVVTIIGMIPGFYLSGLFIWWIFKTCRHKLRIPYFQKQESIQFDASNDMPDRVLCPMNYEAQRAPLFGVNQQKQQQTSKYGATFSPT